MSLGGSGRGEDGTETSNPVEKEVAGSNWGSFDEDPGRRLLGAVAIDIFLLFSSVIAAGLGEWTRAQRILSCFIASKIAALSI
jgi:hypothetical protein